MATIPQRELRNNVSEVLRRAEDGEHFTITVSGRPVAELGPVNATVAFAAPEQLAQVLAASAVDERWADELDRLRGEDHAAAHDPWAR